MPNPKVKMPALDVVPFYGTVPRADIRRFTEDHGLACAEAMREACARYFDERVVMWQEILDNAQLTSQQRDMYRQLIQNDKDDAAAIRAMEIET